MNTLYRPVPDENKPNYCFRLCKQRICDHVECRRAFNRFEFLRLKKTHRRNPFTHRVILKPPKDIKDAARCDWRDQRLQAIRAWKKQNPGEVCDMRLYPHRHGSQPLHWHCAARFSSRAEQAVRAILKRLKTPGQDQYSIAEGYRGYKRRLAYIVGYGSEKKHGIIWVAKRRVICEVGQPFPDVSWKTLDNWCRKIMGISWRVVKLTARL